MYTIPQAARELGVTPGRVRQLIAIDRLISPRRVKRRGLPSYLIDECELKILQKRNQPERRGRPRKLAAE